MVVVRRFRRDLPEVADARGFVAGAVQNAHVVPTDDLLLVTSELVTNAVRHGAGEVEVRVDVSPAAVRVEVLDEGHEPIPEPPGVMPVDGPGGWGLQLVRALSQAWGTGFDQAGRTLVWAEVPVGSNGSTPSNGRSNGRRQRRSRSTTP